MPTPLRDIFVFCPFGYMDVEGSCCRMRMEVVRLLEPRLVGGDDDGGAVRLEDGGAAGEMG